ncbi:MAG: hypothetical protein MUO37_09715 [Methyloceanibacter sp.]|jgi:hypothetical protein|nr:hypothetical protein [Methyloceanibacter sp.]
MTDGSNLVTIRDIDVPFWRIVMILVKWSIASIPAMIILGILVTLISFLVGGLTMSIIDLLGFSPEVPAPPA